MLAGDMLKVVIRHCCHSLVTFILNHVVLEKVSNVTYQMQYGALDDGLPVSWTQQTG